MTLKIISYSALLLCLFAFVTSVKALPDLRSFELGKMEQDVPAVLAADGSCVVTGTGAQAYNGRDDAAFVGLETEALAFTFIARVAKAEGLTTTSKYGLAVRASQWGADKVVNIGYDARDDRRCLQWFTRYSSRMKDDEGGLRCFTDGLLKELNSPQGFWLKLTRRYPYVDMAVSADGVTWTTVAYRAALLAPKVLVGLQATAGGDGKKPITITYDNISYTVDTPAAGADTPAIIKEYAPAASTSKMYLAKVENGKGPFSAYLIVPQNMAPAKIRAILFTPGNKELLLEGNAKVEFDRQDTLRKPTGMADYEGAYEITGLRSFYDALASDGIVRVAGVFNAGDYRKAIERLAVVSGIAKLANVPVLSMGDLWGRSKLLPPWECRGQTLAPRVSVSLIPMTAGESEIISKQCLPCAPNTRCGVVHRSGQSATNRHRARR